jgi:DNA-directed RNA polymerase specialized sigma subunit
MTTSITELSEAPDRALTIADLVGWVDRGPQSVEARLVLGAAASGLPERGRRALGWRLVDEQTQQQVADLVGLPHSQVGRILRRVVAHARSGPVPAA